MKAVVKYPGSKWSLAKWVISFFPEHEELLGVLLRHKGPVLISGYDTVLYRDMLGNWERRENICYSQVGSQKKEVLWMNFEPPGRQMDFEDFGGMI